MMFTFRLLVNFLVLQLLNFASNQIISNEDNQNSFNVHEARQIQEAILTRQLQRNEIFRHMKANFIFNESAEAIVNVPVKELIQKLQLRILSSTQVLSAYIAKALIVHENFNCITEFVPFALNIAQELDKRPVVKGPLHGIPICVKDDHDIIGMDSTLGLGKNLNKPAFANSVLVQSLMDLGAVIFCKTNIPQTLFRYSSDNPIYGETFNHRNMKLAPGGSSCGTASLIGGGGAIIGTGTDIAGSVRIPAHFSGLCTLKPTQNRISDKGILRTLPKLVGLTGVPGVLANDVETVAYVFKALISNGLQNAYDAIAVPIPWNDELFESRFPLKIGYYTSMSFFPAIGDTISTVLDAKKALESLGHVLVPFKIENDWQIVTLMNDLVAVDFGHNSDFSQLFANEPSAKGLEELRASCGRSDWTRTLDYTLSKVSKPGTWEYSARGSLLLQSGIYQDRDRDVWEMIYQKNELISKILTQMEEQNLDLILAPVFPFSACRLNDTGMLFGAVEYTMLWNLVDFPAGVIPFGIETGQNINSYNDEGDAMLRLAKESTKESIGSPIGVQIIGKPFKEEIVLRAMRELYNKATV